MPRPTPREVNDARDRYRRHMKSVNGAQSMDNYFESPYMDCPGRGQAWQWKEGMRLIDLVILAENDIHEHPE